MTALKDGTPLSPAARNEIVDSLSTIIMLHTIHPSSQQLEKVAKKMIKVHLCTADQLPGGRYTICNLLIKKLLLFS